MVPANCKKSPGLGPGRVVRGGLLKSIAAVYQPPARAPGGRNQAARIATATPVTIAAAVIGRAADDDARTAPAVMPATMPAAPGRGGGRRQRGGTKRRRGNCNKREFA